MFELFFALIIYFIIIASVYGYGLVTVDLIAKNFGTQNIGYTGLAGVLILTIYSYFSHFFYSHYAFHNIAVVALGFLGLIFFLKKKIFDTFHFYALLIFLILFLGIIIFKTHDDFPYYHFPYTYYINQNSLMIGIGQFNHGFRTPSSIFYLSSLFYLPVIKLNLFHISSILIMGFSNIIFLEKILTNIKKINYEFYYYLFCLIFVNIFFYRIAEH